MDPANPRAADSERRRKRPPRRELDLGMFGRALDTVHALTLGAAFVSSGAFLVHLSLWLGAWAEVESGIAGATARFVFGAASGNEAAGGFMVTLFPFLTVSVVSSVLAFSISTLRCLYYGCRVYEVLLTAGKGTVNGNQIDIANGPLRATMQPRVYWRRAAWATHALATAALIAAVVFLAARLTAATLVSAATMVALAGCSVLIFHHYKLLMTMLKGKGPRIHQVTVPDRPDHLREVPEADPSPLPMALRLLHWAKTTGIVALVVFFVSWMIFGGFLALVDEHGSATGRNLVSVYDSHYELSSSVMAVHAVIIHTPWVSGALALVLFPFVYVYRNAYRARAVRLLRPFFDRPDVADTHPRDELSIAALALQTGTRTLVGLAGGAGSVLIAVAASPVPAWEAANWIVLLIAAVTMMVAASIVDFVYAPRYLATRDRVLASWPSAVTAASSRRDAAGS